MIHRIIHSVFTGILLLSLIISGCSHSDTENNIPVQTLKGAGTVSASLVLASGIAQLLVTGRVDPHRLTQAASFGAASGSAIGAIDGYQKNQEADNRLPQVQGVFSSEQQRLHAQIGPFNANALVALFDYRYDEALMHAQEAFKMPDKDFQRASLVIQALVELDRNNIEAFSKKCALITTSYDTVISAHNIENGVKELAKKLPIIREHHAITPPSRQP